MDGIDSIANIVNSASLVNIIWMVCMDCMDGIDSIANIVNSASLVNIVSSI